MEDLFAKIGKQKGPFRKKPIRSGVLLRKQGRQGGFGQNAPPSSTPRPEQGMGRAALGAGDSAVWGLGGGSG